MRIPQLQRASTIAARVNGTLSGPDRPVTGVAPVELAQQDDLSFLDDSARETVAGVVLARAPVDGKSTIVVPDPVVALCDLLEGWFPEPAWTTERVHPSAKIALNVVIGPGAVVGRDCEVGDGAVLGPNVVLYPRTRIGARTTIHAGTVIGKDGFRYHPTPSGLRRVPHPGGVTIAQEVEIGALCTIDRGFLSNTHIGSGSRLDDQVHVGHNVVIGRHVVVAAQTGISGSVRIGDGVMIGGQVGIVEHTRIGAGARVGAQSGVHGEIPKGETWIGTPARPIRDMRRIWAALRWLPDLVKEKG